MADESREIELRFTESGLDQIEQQARKVEQTVDRINEKAGNGPRTQAGGGGARIPPPNGPTTGGMPNPGPMYGPENLSAAQRNLMNELRENQRAWAAAERRGETINRARYARTQSQVGGFLEQSGVLTPGHDLLQAPMSWQSYRRLQQGMGAELRGANTRGREATQAEWAEEARRVGVVNRQRQLYGHLEQRGFTQSRNMWDEIYATRNQIRGQEERDENRRRRGVNRQQQRQYDSLVVDNLHLSRIPEADRAHVENRASQYEQSLMLTRSQAIRESIRTYNQETQQHRQYIRDMGRAQRERVTAANRAVRTDSQMFQAHIADMSPGRQYREINRRMAGMEGRPPGGGPPMPPGPDDAYFHEYNQLARQRAGAWRNSTLGRFLARPSGMGLFMNAMFGGWELGQAYMGVKRAQNEQAAARTRPEYFAALINEGRAGASGIFGSIVGASLDLFGRGPESNAQRLQGQLASMEAVESLGDAQRNVLFNDKIRKIGDRGAFSEIEKARIEARQKFEDTQANAQREIEYLESRLKATFTVKKQRQVTEKMFPNSRYSPVHTITEEYEESYPSVQGDNRNTILADRERKKIELDEAQKNLWAANTEINRAEQKMLRQARLDSAIAFHLGRGDARSATMVKLFSDLRFSRDPVSTASALSNMGHFFAQEQRDAQRMLRQSASINSMASGDIFGGQMGMLRMQLEDAEISGNVPQQGVIRAQMAALRTTTIRERNMAGRRMMTEMSQAMLSGMGLDYSANMAGIRGQLGSDLASMEGQNGLTGFIQRGMYGARAMARESALKQDAEREIRLQAWQSKGMGAEGQIRELLKQLQYTDDPVQRERILSQASSIGLPRMQQIQDVNRSQAVQRRQFEILNDRSQNLGTRRFRSGIVGMVGSIRDEEMSLRAAGMNPQADEALRLGRERLSVYERDYLDNFSQANIDPRFNPFVFNSRYATDPADVLKEIDKAKADLEEPGTTSEQQIEKIMNQYIPQFAEAVAKALERLMV